MSLEGKGGRSDAFFDMPPKQVNTCPLPAANGSILEMLRPEEIGHQRALHLELSNPDLLKSEQKVIAFSDLYASHIH